MILLNNKYESLEVMSNLKSGFVTITGRPNVGKSTFLNSILGQKIAIITPKAQTTRKSLKGIYTDIDKGQIIFVDTPGIIKALDKMGDFLLSESLNANDDCDIILFILDISSKCGKSDIWIFENIIKKSKSDVIVVFNKSDLVDENKLNINFKTYEEICENYPYFFISSKNDKNFENIISLIYQMLPNGNFIYPVDNITDESMREISREIIREKIMLLTHNEIPHSVMIVIDNYIEKDNIDEISATIYVDKDSQKGVIIGKNGQMLKNIGTKARLDLENITGKKVFLKLYVKVSKNWKKNKKLIDKWMNKQ